MLESLQSNTLIFQQQRCMNLFTFWVINIIKKLISLWVKLAIKLDFLSFKNFFKLSKYDNTFTGDLENTEQSYM